MGTKFKGEKDETRALDAYIKLMRAAESVSVRVHRHLDAAHLTISQFGVLEALLHLGPLSQKDLSRKILKTGGNMTMVIDNLEKQGLVKRVRGEQDRRFFAIHLTAKGRGLINRVFPVHVDAVMREMKFLSGEEQEMLGRLCKKVGVKEGT